MRSNALSHHGPVRSPALSRYIASLVLGAGVFTIPFEIATVGLVPMAALLLVAAAAARWLYPRMIHHCGGEGGAAQPVSAAIVAVGAGSAGRRTALVGAAMSAVPNGIGYTMLGIAALRQIAQVIGSFDEPAVAALLLAVGCRIASEHPSISHGWRSVCALGTRWLSGIAVVAAFNFAGIVESMVLAAVFVAGVLYLLAHDTDDTTNTTTGLSVGHDRSVAALRTQLTVMGLLALVLVGLAVGSGRTHIPTLVANPSNVELARAVGIALAAYNAAGFTNASRYAPMRSPYGSSRVSSLSVRIVWGTQVLWMLGAGVLVSNGELGRLDATGSYSTVGMIASVEALIPQVGEALVVTAAVVLLFAVSNGCAAGVEMLSREVTASWPVAVRSRLSASNRQLLLLAIVGLGSVWAVSSGVAVNTLIAVAGLHGGTLLLVVLPLLTEGARRGRWYFGVAVLGAATFGACGVVISSGRPQTTLAVVSGLVIVGLTIGTSRQLDVANRESSNPRASFDRNAAPGSLRPGPRSRVGL